MKAPISPPSPAGGSVPTTPLIGVGDADGGVTRTAPPSAPRQLVRELPMTLDDACDHIGARVQYTSASGAIVTTGHISGVGTTSVFVRYGQGMFTGDPVATDPRRLRLL